MNIRPLESLTKDELIELIRLERRGEPVAKEIERRVYHNTSEYKSYLSARFDRSRSNSRVSFEWGGHRWAYRYTHFDDCGEYDLIVRPLPAPQPDHIPDAGKMVVSDRSMKEIKAALAGAKGKEHTLIFSAKEVRGLLNTIVNQNQRIERFEKKIADHIAQDRKMAEPVFWYRPYGDGGIFEGPVHHSYMDDELKQSGQWVPLYAGSPSVKDSLIVEPAARKHTNRTEGKLK